MKKAYYILIHFGIPKPIYVTGFIIPVAMDEEDALAQLIASLEAHDIVFGTPDSIHNELSSTKIKEYLWSLNRPNEINKRGSKLVEILEISKPIVAGYWLQEIGEISQLCNTKK